MNDHPELEMLGKGCPVCHFPVPDHSYRCTIEKRAEAAADELARRIRAGNRLRKVVSDE